MKHILASLFAVALVAGTLSGCGGDGEEAPVDNMQTSETTEAPVPKKRRRMPTPDEQAATPAPTPTPVARTRAFLARNVAYDKMRTKAMTMVYVGQTKKAMNTFESVQQMRPEDPAVRAWLAAIRKSAKQARDAAPTAQDDFKTASQNLRGGAGPLPGGAPALPAPNLPGGSGAFGGRAGGSAGGAGAPAPAASPLEIDPKLVF
jgi:type IV secretory pathway VirB10-like protein